MDRERNGHIEELSRKLSHAHATSEQYRSQAEATNKRLTQAEEAKRAVETELSNLKLEVQAHSDSRFGITPVSANTQYCCPESLTCGHCRCRTAPTPHLLDFQAAGTSRDRRPLY